MADFMSAMTEIGELVQKKLQIVRKTASLLSEAIVDRARNGKLNGNTKIDIKNSLKEFSDEEKVDILTEAIILVAQQNSTKKTFDDAGGYIPPSKKGGKRSSIFGY